MTLVESQPAPEVSAHPHRPLGLHAWGYLDGHQDLQILQTSPARREQPHSDGTSRGRGPRSHDTANPANIRTRRFE